MNSYAEINLKAFSHNLRFIRNFLKPSTKIMAVIKANAYGHGPMMLARQAEAEGIEMLGVANLPEAIELKNAGIKLPVLILSGIMEDQAQTFLNYDFSTVIHSKEIAASLYAEAKKKKKPIKVHLKVDTGMGRLGFNPNELRSFLNQYTGAEFFIFEGLMTHLASSYEKNKKGFTNLQIKTFNALVEELRTGGISFPLIHCANSAGIIDFPQSHFNMVRPGIVLYGISPFDENRNDLDIKPVLSWKARVIQLTHVPKGKPISYGGTYITERDSIIATISVGYADGYSRLLSNNIEVLINGKLAPQIGRICMDLTMIDVTDIPEISVGDEVVLIGMQGKKEIKVKDLSDKIGTISYEILCGIGNRVTRIYNYRKSNK